MTLSQEIREIPSTRTALRKFGCTMAVAFGLLGGFMLWKGHESALYLCAPAALFLIFGLAWPLALRPIQRAWMTLALLMGWVMSRVILTALFYLVVTPIGLILRLTGKDLLDRKSGVRRDSYWSAHRGEAKDDYADQF